MAEGDVQMKIPESLSFEDASTLSLGVTTVMQGLYQKAMKLQLPLEPVKEKTYVLIYGGSTATGALGIQFAKLSVSLFHKLLSLNPKLMWVVDLVVLS